MAVRREAARGGGCRGLGIAARAALHVGGALAAAAVLLALVVYAIVGAQLEDEFDRAGVAAARALASSGYSSWTDAAGTPLAMKDLGPGSGARFEKELKALALAPEDAAAVGRVRDFNRKKIAELAGGGDLQVLNAYIATSDNQALQSFRAPEAFVPAGSPWSLGRTRISPGRYAGVAARLYQHPVSDSGGTPRATSNVLVSEGRIAAAKSRVLLLVGLLGLLLAGAGAAVAAVSASGVRRSLDDLTLAVGRLNRGHLEYRSPVRTGEVGALGRALEKMTDELRAAQELEATLVAREKETSVAAELRENLLPTEVPAFPGFELEGTYRAGKGGGGDFYDMVKMRDGRLALLVSSASGSGPAAAMVMAMARAFLRSSLEAETDPRAALVRANESLERDIRKGMFVTVLMAVLDPRESKVLLFSAGSRMPAARCAAGDAQWIHGEGIALGLDKGAVFERTLKPVEIVLVPGTRIALVNEGAALARSPDGKAFGEEKLLALLKQHGPKNSAAFVNLAVGTLEKHVGSGGFNVDVALVTAKRTA